MKIAIDLSQIIYGTGVSHYRENLVKNLLKIDTSNEYLLFGGSLRQIQNLKFKIQNLIQNSKLVKSKFFPIPPRLADVIWNKLHILPIEKLIGKVDVIHTSDWAEPPSNLSKVTTIHDLIALKFTKLTPKIITETHAQRLKWVGKESKRIIVPSNQTKADLVQLGFDVQKICVIYESNNFSKVGSDKVKLVKAKYSLHEDYLITIGTNPRKNIKRMVEAYHLSKFGKNLKFVVVGESKDLNLGQERGVRVVGRIPDSDLEALITGSKALLFASIYEGFGAPILDGFNCEVPVVTSSVGSMKEVAGDGAILVDSYDVNSIAEGIEEALSKPKTYITKGLKRAKAFSWQKCAKETLEVYKEASGENRI